MSEEKKAETFPFYNNQSIGIAGKLVDKTRSLNITAIACIENALMASRIHKTKSYCCSSLYEEMNAASDGLMMGFAPKRFIEK